ncbi:MAG: hypothetical protein ACI814_003937, partial [Mariniblastus sp.]
MVVLVIGRTAIFSSMGSGMLDARRAKLRKYSP